MQGVPLVVLANKQDLINALPAAEVTYSRLHVSTSACPARSAWHAHNKTPPARCHIVPSAFCSSVSHHPQAHVPCKCDDT